jgi:hypothetical protein
MPVNDRRLTRRSTCRLCGGRLKPRNRKAASARLAISSRDNAGDLADSIMAVPEEAPSTGSWRVGAT